jgi:hypothetical protein
MATTIYSPQQLSQMMDRLGGRVTVLDGYGLPQGMQGQVATLTARMNGFDTKLRQAVASLQSQLTAFSAVVGTFLQNMKTILSLPVSTLTSPSSPSTPAAPTTPLWNAIATTSAATTVDFSKGTTTKVTITQDTTISLTNGTQGEPYILILTQDATGHNVTFDATSEGVSQVPTTANQTSVLAFVFDGTTFLLQGSPITGL